MKKYTTLYCVVLAFLFVTACATNSPETKSEEAPVYNQDPYNDVMTIFYEDGSTVKQTLEMEDSLKHGKAIQYYESGEVHTQMKFDKGLRVDTSYNYYKSGKLSRTTPYQADEKHGLQLGYYQNGDLMYEMPYKYGTAVAGLKEYEEDGTLTDEPSLKFEKNGNGGYNVSVFPKRTKVDFYNVYSSQVGREVVYTTQNKIESKRGKCEINSPRMIGAKVYSKNKTAYVIFGRP